MSSVQTDVINSAPDIERYTRAEVINIARKFGITADDLRDPPPPPEPEIFEDFDTYRIIRRRDGSDVDVMKMQDAKYGVIVETAEGAFLAKLSDGEVIPHDEPVFILRAQDKYAIAAIQEYCRQITGAGTANREMTGPTAHAALEAFSTFRDRNPRRMKQPD